jgi:hypothetical protein
VSGGGGERVGEEAGGRNNPNNVCIMKNLKINK